MLQTNKKMTVNDMISFIEVLEDYSGFISKEMSGNKKDFEQICEEIIACLKKKE